MTFNEFKKRLKDILFRLSVCLLVLFVVMQELLELNFVKLWLVITYYLLELKVYQRDKRLLDTH